MGYFDDIEKNKDLEIRFNKMLSAFISIAEDLIEEEERLAAEKKPADLESHKRGRAVAKKPKKKIQPLAVPLADPMVTNCQTPKTTPGKDFEGRG